MEKRWILISMFAGVLLIVAPTGEAQEAEAASGNAATIPLTFVEALPDTGSEGARSVTVHACGSKGTVLRATMGVTATGTRIVLGETADTAAINSEIGNDFKLSFMGPSADPNYDALYPAVAYNSTDNQYLVVWQGSDDTVGEYEIWGQRVNAATGVRIGADFQISFTGTSGDADRDAEDPDVAYNSASNEYLVVWSGDHYADGDFEIFGRRVDADTGTLLGMQVRVSVMGPVVDPDYDARSPAVAYNSTDNEYLVVWEGDDNDDSLADDEFEIWGQLLEGEGTVEWIGSDFLISEMGGYGNADYDAYDPDVAYNSTDNQYMVVYEGDESFYGVADNEFEIWGHRLSATGGAMGVRDFRISTMGPSDDADYDAGDPAIAYNSHNNQYLVVWEGEDSAVDLYDIFGQRLEANGLSVGSDDFYLSHVGSGPNSDYDAVNPAVAYDEANNEYLAVWQDDELAVGEYEIWGQRVDAGTGAAIDIDTRLSDMGPDGNAAYIAQTPAVAYSGVSNHQYLVVWSGDNSTDGEFEIWGQRFAGGHRLTLPLVLREY